MTTNRYYPIALDMTARPVLVIGGGAVAERKVEGLLAVGARVTLLSPALTPRLAGWVEEGRVTHVARGYRPDDLAGQQLVFVATDDRAVNAAVAREGRARAVLVNAADDPDHCDFILPSVLRRGDLIVAVTTGGASPALAGVIREELEPHFSESYAALLEVVAEVRAELRHRSIRASGETWRRALDADLRRLIGAGRRAEAKARLLESLGVVA